MEKKYVAKSGLLSKIGKGDWGWWDGDWVHFK